MTNDTYAQRKDMQDLLDLMKTEPIIIVYDLETTGLNPKENHIIQLSASMCLPSSEGLTELERKNWYINPGYALPQFISGLTGITDEFLEDKPTESEALLEIMQFFGTLPVMGYCNKQFDDRFMDIMYQRYGASFQPVLSYDIYGLVKKLFRVSEVKNHKLATIAKYIGISEKIKQFHNAEGDMIATILIANYCLDICRKLLQSPTKPGIRCHVTSVRPWRHPQNPKMKRLYVETDVTTFFFDQFARIWHTKDEDDFVSLYDMENVIQQVLQTTQCQDEKALAKWNGRNHLQP